ncbi:hypothetical protein IHE44_0014851 [Lamprotornis superbus]|uniref:Glutaredoxin domain-containing protein n=1 Tax=Lamprotornis superbus TaxID=245042 RepID=A0A835U0W8_9PASS|nr:hypothetical protein IHE44_0014851 [Lamprotornis superbus]
MWPRIMGNSQTTSLRLSNDAAVNQIQDIISQNCVVIFSKTTCPYCKMAKNLFESLNVNYTAVELDKNTNGRQFQDVLEQMTGGRTVLLQQGYLQQWNSKGHEELDNIVALFSYPAEELDVAKLVSVLTAALVESKSRVQHGETTLLLKAVDAVELEDNRDGLIHVVQARIARKTLVKFGTKAKFRMTSKAPVSKPQMSNIPLSSGSAMVLGGTTSEDLYETNHFFAYIL